MHLNISSLFVFGKKRLFTLSSGKKIGWFSLLLILCLDLQVLYFVLDGTDKAENTVSYPTNPVPEMCKGFFDLFTHSKQAEKIDFLRSYVFSNDANRSLRGLIADGFEDDNISLSREQAAEAATAKECVNARSELLKIREDRDLRGDFAQLHSFDVEISRLQGEIDRLKRSYDSSLLEKIAGQEKKNSILPASADQTKNEIDTKSAQVASIQNQIQGTQQAILVSPAITQMVNFSRESHTDVEFPVLEKVYNREVVLHPVKSLGMGLVFLFPLIMASMLWHSRALRKDAPVQIMASSHLSFVFCLPILFKLFDFIYRLLPLAFLSKFIDFLSSLNIAFIWNYIVIIVSIAVVGLVIIISQKFIFNALRRQRNKIKNKECAACGERLQNLETPFCYYCGAGQFTECKSCHSPVNKNFLHCPQCGSS